MVTGHFRARDTGLGHQVKARKVRARGHEEQSVQALRGLSPT